jgi:20S proteasome alpha/beta subunit
VAIGSRCQTANTFLENKVDQLENATADQLIKLAIEAMKKALDVEVTVNNVAISVVGKGQDYKILSTDELSNYVGNHQGMEIVV